MKYLLLLICFFINILSAKEFSLEAYSSTKRDRIKVADNFVYENIEMKTMERLQWPVWFSFLLW